ncbi:MAG: hypothetical protein WAU82_01440 [Candidatus Binatus sp.]|uniref:hypothetical protein n=1 Tax=Candidatus Binatus sp. TaxID=2811406 RepID=UPI003BB0CD1D
MIEQAKSGQVSTISITLFCDGGGVYVGSGTSILSFSTISGNVASGAGGGIFVNSGATAIVKNTIVANSTGGNCSSSGTFTSDGHNLSDDTDHRARR